jgi:cell division protein FtsL
VPFGLFALCVVAVMIVGLVAAQALVAQDSFRLAALARTAERLEEDYGRLRLRAAELSSPERIASAAKRAGLVLPHQVELISLPPVTGPERGEDRPGDGGTLALKGVLGGAP